MTLGRDNHHQSFAGAAGAAGPDSSFGREREMQRKQERTKRQRRAAAVIDLASQSSSELQSPSANLGSLLAGKERAFAVGVGLGIQPTNHLQVHTGRMHAVGVQCSCNSAVAYSRTLMSLSSVRLTLLLLLHHTAAAACSSCRSHRPGRSSCSRAEKILG